MSDPTPPASITYRAYEPADRAGVVALLRGVFPETTSEESYRWRFEQHPLGEPLRVVAEQNGGIVGFNSWIPWPMSFNGRPLRTWQSGESVVDPAMRGQGVFGRLIHLGAELGRSVGGDLFFGYPNQASVGAFQRAGWKLLHTLQWWAKPTPLAWLGIRRTARPPQAVTEAMRKDTFVYVRDRDFVRWRFDENPYHTYENVVLPDGGRIITRTLRRGGLRERRIVIGLDREGGLLDPAATAHFIARRNRFSSFVATALPPTATRESSAMSGFHKLSGKGVFFIVLALEPELSRVYEPEAWLPALGDADIT